jgi:hypothetical protein
MSSNPSTKKKKKITEAKGGGTKNFLGNVEERGGDLNKELGRERGPQAKSYSRKAM